MIENTECSEAIEGSSDRVFGLVFAGVFSVVALWPLVQGEAIRLWAMLVAVAFLVLAIAIPRSLSQLNRLWMRLGLLMGRVVSPVAIGIVYYLTVVPTGLIMRALGKDPLRLRFERELPSYWIKREPPGPNPKTMNDQF